MTDIVVIVEPPLPDITVTLEPSPEVTVTISEVGERGEQGIQGEPGPQGIQGEQGPPGTNGTDGASTAAAITYTPTGGIAATNVQTALAEIDTETVKLTGAQSISGIKTWVNNAIMSAALTIAGTLNLKAGVGSVSWGTNNPNIRTGNNTSSGFLAINSGTIGDNTLYLNLDNPTAPVAASNMLINIAGAPAQRALFQVNPDYSGTIGAYNLAAWGGVTPTYKVPFAAHVNVSNGGNTPAAYLPALVLGRDGVGGQSYNNHVEFKIGKYGTSGTQSKTAMTIALVEDSGGNKGADVMTLQGDGKVGIGTTTPGEALHVVGNIKTTGTITATVPGADRVPVIQTLTGSSWTWTTPAGWTQAQVFISGGTGLNTTIDAGTGGGAVTLVGGTGVQPIICAGDTITVSWSTTPTFIRTRRTL